MMPAEYTHLRQIYGKRARDLQNIFVPRLRAATAAVAVTRPSNYALYMVESASRTRRTTGKTTYYTYTHKKRVSKFALFLLLRLLPLSMRVAWCGVVSERVFCSSSCVLRCRFFSTRRQRVECDMLACVFRVCVRACAREIYKSVYAHKYVVPANGRGGVALMRERVFLVVEELFLVIIIKSFM